MSDAQGTQTQSSRGKSGSSGSSGGNRQPARTGQSSATTLQSSQGVTSIDDGVVGKIAAIAAREIDGVAQLGGAVSGALAGVVGRIRGQGHQTGGIGVEVGEHQAAIDLTMIARYPAPIADVAENVRRNIIERVEELTGLEVVEVNIAVTDLEFPGGESAEDAGPAPRRVQ